MYLKSLVLKGFKSFADRVELSLEPGLIAVVGPNGSGKSNISDAVLWVLGERNAKNLRGQVMEDVIFAGSSARKSVRVAEVELVLDNSDGVLPVDYAEVSVARRMYRSGESEYLINGSIARRMDVLDILHDSGLGTGTNSIISQGHLDSILQSKPEDRRALIEEAAGVLKHKQRKAKSARRLEQMDQHLARVRDVADEVARQLGPLKRRASRAIAYQEVSAELADLTLRLAVDDLRALQRSWNEAEQQEAALVAELEERRCAIRDAEAASERIQESIRRAGADAESLSRSRQRAAAAVSGLDADFRLASEKLRSAQRRVEELRSRIEADAERACAAQTTQANAEASLAEAEGLLAQARLDVQQASEAHEAAVEQRARLEREVFASQQRRRDADAAVERARTTLLATKEKHAGDKGKSQLLAERAAEAETALTEAREAAAAAEAKVAELEASVAEAKAHEEARRDADEEAAAARAAADAERAAAADAERAAAGDIAAVEAIERSASSALGEARGWLAENAEAAGAPDAAPLADLVAVDEGYESLVEAILGSDASALVVADAETVGRVADSLRLRDEEGEVTLVARRDQNRSSLAEKARAAALACGGVALIDVAHPALGAEAAFEALAGDVVVCEDERAALDAYRSGPRGLRYAARTGFVAWPSGKATMGVRVAPEGEGAFARARQRAAAADALEKARTARREAEALLAELTIRAASDHEEHLAAQRERSLVEGKLAAAKAAARDAGALLARREREVGDAAARRNELIRALDGAASEMQRQEAELAACEKAAAEAASAFSAAQDAVAPAREVEQRATKALSEARLSEATLAERAEFAQRSRAAAQRELASVKEDETAARRTMMRQTVVERRAAPLLALLEGIAAQARSLSDLLEQRAADAREAAAGTHARSDEVRAQVKRAHEAFDATSERLSAVRVEKSGLSVRVEAGVSVIVTECKMPLEEALKLPALDDRSAVEDEAFRLRRRIASMGTINPDAAIEYEELKSRHDYLAAQLADLDSARLALGKIDRVIDERMKDDFIATFGQVNENFQEIFSILFPGGSAELSLIDPDDLENTGVEVSAQPRGKRITKMSLMSGGEKSLVALALLFATYRIRSAPFYILDEVEAALDDTNLRRLTGYFQSLRESTQLILITHQRRTMEIADVLFGVSMQADGVTKVISQRLENALRYAEQ